jgi:oxygen-dependent protoporphyrinogen oxidase
MPQYHIGHTELVNSIRTSISQYESLRLCGNAYEGVGIPDCIRSGQKAAEQIIEALKKEPSLSGGSPS